MEPADMPEPWLCQPYRLATVSLSSALASLPLPLLLMPRGKSLGQRIWARSPSCCNDGHRPGENVALTGLAAGAGAAPHNLGLPSPSIRLVFLAWSVDLP